MDCARHGLIFRRQVLAGSGGQVCPREVGQAGDVPEGWMDGRFSH